MAGIPHDHYEPKPGIQTWLHKRLPIVGLAYDTLMIPTPKNLNWMWIWGIVLAFCLVLQIVTGIVLVNRYEVGATQDEFQWVVPFKVSVSLDGKTWTEVASFHKAEAVFRVDLQGRKLLARHVRAERQPSADKSKPPGRFHLRSFQVFGKKLY